MPTNPYQLALAQQQINDMLARISPLGGLRDQVRSKLNASLLGQLSDQYDQNKSTVSDFSQLQQQAQQAFSPDTVNKIFNTQQGNLGQMGATQAARARSTAASLFGGRANPSAAILGAGNQAQAPFQAAQGQSEVNRSQALQSALQNLLGFNTQLNRYQQSDESDAQRQALAQAQLFQQNQQFQQQLEQSQAGDLDWITALLPLLAAPVSGGTSILGSILYPGTTKG